MKKKENLLDPIYRKKLLQLARFYKVADIKKQLIKNRRKLTNRQIELFLKKNGIHIPKKSGNLVEKSGYFYLKNFSKIVLASTIVICFFGLVPLLFENVNKMKSYKLVKIEDKTLENKSLNSILSKNSKKTEIKEKFLLKPELKPEQDETPIESTVRLSASTINELFKQENYFLNKIRKSKKVKPFKISVLPGEMDKIENTKEKKELFIKIILPLILEENNKILSDRKKMFRILGKKYNSRIEKKWLNKKFKEYDIKDSDISALKVKMDIIPVSLAIAQAAKETGWGSSRFAQEGNALYGQWTFSEDGMVPYDSVTEGHKVLRFKILQASVRAYKRNLNTHRGYKDFRKARAEMRKNGENVNSLELANYLDKYAQTGIEYTEIIKKIILQNSLTDFDDVRLLPTRSIINQKI